MLAKVKLLERKDQPFKGQDGTEIPYYWYKAERGEDGVSIRFGSVLAHEIGKDLEVNLEKKERLNRGKVEFLYTEIVPKSA